MPCCCRSQGGGGNNVTTLTPSTQDATKHANIHHDASGVAVAVANATGGHLVSAYGTSR
jgi:hypothetical protein